MDDHNQPARVREDIKLFGSLLGLSELECDQMAYGGSANARRRCRDELAGRYFRENRPEPLIEWDDRKRVENRDLSGLQQLEFWQDAGKAASFVYFIQSGEHGPVKIGLAQDPLRRMAELQTGNPEDLFLRHVVPGKRADEGKLHHRFREARVRGEWFGLSYLEIILIYGAGLATSQIRCFEQTDSLGVMPLGHRAELADLRSEGEQFKLRKEIERMWNVGFNARQIAEYLWELNEEEIRAELKEMRKDSYWRVGRRDGRSGITNNAARHMGVT